MVGAIWKHSDFGRSARYRCCVPCEGVRCVSAPPVAYSSLRAPRGRICYTCRCTRQLQLKLKLRTSDSPRPHALTALFFSHHRHRPQVLLSPNRTMVARHLVVYRTRAVSVDMAPGVDMLMPLQPGTIAFVAMEDGAVIHKTCNPPGIMAQSLASPSNPRPRLVPGKQTLVDRIPQPPTCINTTDETVPAMRRCWLARGTYDDLAVFSAAPDERTLLPVPDNMVGAGRGWDWEGEGGRGMGEG